MKKVDFFIVGAPKCGTTSLAQYLAVHPQVFFSKNKEPYFFSNDLPSWQFEKSLEEYEKYNFNGFEDEGLVYGEGSTWYLYSDNAIKNIYEYNSSAKILLLLRNPAEMLHSLFEFRKYGGAEFDKPFSVVWGYNSLRKKGRKIPFQWKNENKLLFYDEIAKYGNQLENILNYFDERQVKVIFFEDFIKDTSGVYEEVLEFLCLKKNEGVDFKVHNEGGHNKTFRILRVIWKSIFRIFPYTVYEKFRKKINIGSLEPFLMKIGIVGKGKSSELPYDLKVEILKCYFEDIKKLEKITKSDLKEWYI